MGQPVGPVAFGRDTVGAGVGIECSGRGRGRRRAVDAPPNRFEFAARNGGAQLAETSTRS